MRGRIRLQTGGQCAAEAVSGVPAIAADRCAGPARPVLAVPRRARAGVAVVGVAAAVTVGAVESAEAAEALLAA